MTLSRRRSSCFYCAAFLPLVLLGSTLVSLSASPVAIAGDVRVMSFNIRYGTASDGENHWERRKEFVAETIAAYDPDLLGTQETLEFQKQFLEQQMPGYTSVGVGRDDGSDKGEMTALFFKTKRFELRDEGHFWLSETPGKAGSKSWDSSLPRICSWVRLKDRQSNAPREILFINTHFDHRGQQARNESAALVLRKIDELGADCDVVLTGDFNSSVTSVPYRTLFADAAESSRLVDTFAVAGTKETKGDTTISRFLGDQFAGPRIDWIATRGNWKILDAQIDRTAKEGRAPSDHYPVTARLQRDGK
ncbi:Endonuclease/Exonuclease/phosphatase family protein [Rosistilla oblonga]|uniref:endonuclease/exonuclease/phosphatase family protein n=1 Tax=Rosistilla oblonga TaxID=2527990 RepID=UPI00118A2088|nr:endonuclease/exonuclease/phosphatase family protein [Rosistilla oblonga]QDV10547.1 Endonuclease/Exonuclease/phosphatase family protein [Rosistilla oblonga]